MFNFIRPFFTGVIFIYLTSITAVLYLSIYVLDSLFAQTLFKSCLVYLLVTSYSIHFFTQSMSSFRNTCPYHCNLFCCSTKIISSIHSLSQLFTWTSIFYLNVTHPSGHLYLYPVKCYLVFSERELTFTFAICYRPSVCRLSVVCNVRAPYSGG